MKFLLSFGLGALFLHSFSFAGTPVSKLHEIELRSTLSTSPVPLVPSDFATLDPGEINPHLARWALGRSVELLGLHSLQDPAKPPSQRVGVTASGLEADAVIHLRASGPWYEPLDQFPCQEKQASSLFMTEEGAKTLANQAAHLWEDLLIERKLKLSYDLSRVAESSPPFAVRRAERIFKEWLAATDREWRERVAGILVPREWKTLRSAAESAGFCNAERASAKRTPEIWPDAWPSAPETQKADLLFRSPAKRVGGYFTIRVDLKVGAKSVSGPFLIDPASPQSVVSPDWLLSQGVQPLWVEIPEAPPSQVRVDAGEGARGLAKSVGFEDSISSGYSIGIRRFQLFDVSELFDEPNAPTACCAGVLGQDFLSRYSVEFHPEAPAELMVRPVSSSLGGLGPPGQKSEDLWVEVRRARSKKYSLGVDDLFSVCSPRVRALGNPKLCESPIQVMKDAVGSFALDLTQGKFWFSKREADTPPLQNRSGVELGFGYVNKSRALVVKSLMNNPQTADLTRAGLRKGDVILELDGVSAPSLDIWEVNRYLSAVHGDLLTLKWLPLKEAEQGLKKTPSEKPHETQFHVLPPRERAGVDRVGRRFQSRG